MKYKGWLLAEHYGIARITIYPMFDAWAKSRGFEIFPGTLNIKSETMLMLPDDHISLMPWEHLINGNSMKIKPGYSPRLYPIELNGIKAWLFRWSEDVYLDCFVGDRPNCSKELFCEIVSEYNLKTILGINDLDEVELTISKGGE